MKKRTRCPVCNRRTKLSLVYQLPKFRVLKCFSCGVGFRDVTFSLSETKSLYSRDYFESLQRDYFDLAKPARWQEARRRLDQVQKISGIKSGVLLDIGCAKGVFLHLASQSGWRTQGVELSRFAASIAVKKFRQSVVVGELSTARFPKNYFDVITGWDVVDHIENPHDFIKEIHRILAPGGWLFLQTTMTDSLIFLLAHLSYAATQGLFYGLVETGYPVHHSIYLNRVSFKNLLTNRGFIFRHSSNEDMVYEQTSLPKWSWGTMRLLSFISSLAGRTIECLMVVQKK